MNMCLHLLVSCIDSRGKHKKLNTVAVFGQKAGEKQG